MIFTLIFFILTAAIAPSIIAYNTERTDTHEKDKETKGIGKIYGYTHCSHGVWTWDPIPYARVRVGTKITKSDERGYYEISGLQVDHTYRVVATRLGYFRTVEKFTLISEKPEKEIYIDMYSFIDWLFDLL